ncbi:MAG: hypothetical protein M3512_07130 [Bacteroidota bacterium]|nr:hypothetical protein [Bacteroidota bacterium]
MKKLFHITVLLIFLAFSCERARELPADEKIVEEKTTVNGLLSLNGNWHQDSSIVWTYILPDSIWTEIILKDTSDYPNYRITEVYRKQVGDSLKITKQLSWDPKNKRLLEETDVYEKQLTNFLQARLSISYDYLTKTYHTDLLDSIATEEKLEANRAKLDSMTEYAKENNLYLCGTAAHAILWEDVPFLPVPKEIEKEEAIKIAKAWRKD